MARYRCRSCGQIVYDPEGHACPDCGSTDVQYALSVDELPDDHPISEAMRSITEEASDDEQGRRRAARMMLD